MNNKFYNRNILILGVAFLLIQCGSQQKQLEGIFIEKESRIKEIHITKDSYLIIGDNRDKSFKRDYFCCDTLSYGLKTLDKGFLIFNSSPKFNPKLNLVAEEKINNAILDSIKISISTPLDSHLPYTSVLSSGDILKEKNTFLKYSLTINSEHIYNIDQSDEASVLISKKDLNDEDLIDISLIVSIDGCKSLPISNKGIEEVILMPYPYIIKNNKINQLNISIPDLNYEYLNFIRLNEDYIKIKNENTLIWDGKEYHRKDR